MPSYIKISAVLRRKWPSQSKEVLGADRQKSQEGRFQHYIGKHSLATAAAQRWNEYPTRAFAPHPKRRPRASIQKQCDQSNGGVETDLGV